MQTLHCGWGGDKLCLLKRRNHTRRPIGNGNVCAGHKTINRLTKRCRAKCKTSMVCWRCNCRWQISDTSAVVAACYNNWSWIWLPPKCKQGPPQNSSMEQKGIFENTNVQISTNAQRHLGAAIGTQEFIEVYAAQKVGKWLNEIKSLTAIARTHPHAAYAAYVHGVIGRWL